MLKKIFKYDYFWIHRQTVWYMVALLVSCVAANVSDRIFNGPNGGTLMWLVINKLCSALMVAACIALLLNAFIRLMGRFTSTLFKDQSYFTHTLPVRRGTVFDAKALVGAATLAGVLVCIAAGMFLGLVNESFLESLKLLFRQKGVVSLLLLMACSFYMQSLCILASAYLGFILGYRQHSGKNVCAVLFTFLIYSFAEGLLLCGVAAFSMLNSSVGDMLHSNVSSFAALTGADVVKTMMGVILAEYVVVVAVLFLLGRKALEKGVNVE